MELTIEVNCCKYPDRKELIHEWDYNLKSLISYVEQAQRGIRGLVTDARTGLPVSGARIRVRRKGSDPDPDFRKKDITSAGDGRYWRILLPGDYDVKAVLPDGRESRLHQVTVLDDHPTVVPLKIQTPDSDVPKFPTQTTRPSTFRPDYEPLFHTDANSNPSDILQFPSNG